MKKMWFNLILIGILSLVFTGCGSEDSEAIIENGETIADYNIKFFSDGNELVSSEDIYSYTLVENSFYVEYKTFSNMLDSFSSEDAQSYCSNLSYTYLTEWRLPALGELDVITDITLEKNIFNYEGSESDSTNYMTSDGSVSYICRNGGLSCGFGGTGPKLVICVQGINATSNHAPIADAGGDQIIVEGNMVDLDASNSSDSDGYIMGYEWKEGDIVLSNKSSFTLSDLAPGTHSITLTVMDNNQVKATDSMSIIVAAVSDIENQIEQLINIEDASFNTQYTSNEITITEDVLIYGTIATVTNGDIILNDLNVGNTTNISVDDKISIQITSSSEYNTTTDSQLVIGNFTRGYAVTTLNNPVPVADAGMDQNFTFAQVVTLDGGTSYDPNDDSLTYTWSIINKPITNSYGESDVNIQEPDIINPSFSLDFQGIYEFELTVSDGISSSTDNVIVNYNRLSRDDNGIVTDHYTNLMWQDNDSNMYIGDDTGGASYGATMEDAVAFCNNLVLGGYIDWQLPNFLSMRTIYDTDYKYSTREEGTNTTFSYLSKDDYYWVSDNDTSSIRMVETISGSYPTTISDYSFGGKNLFKCVRNK